MCSADSNASAEVVPADSDAAPAPSDTSVALLIQIAESRLAPHRCPLCGLALDEYVGRSLQDGFLDIFLLIQQCCTCGHRTVTVDESGPIRALGRILTLNVLSAIDLERDAAISSTASLSIPELGLDLSRGQLGSRFVKVGRMLDEIYADLNDPQRSPMTPEFRAFMARFRARLDAAADFSVMIDDPCGRSIISGVNAANITVRDYVKPNDDVTLSATHE